MAKLSKRAKAYRAQVEAGKVYPLAEALTLLKSVPAAKFVESVDVAINLGIDPRKSDQYRKVCACRRFCARCCS